MSERAGSTTEDKLSELADVSNILLLAPSLGGQGADVCLDVISRTKPSETNILTVTYTDTPQEWVDNWIDHAGVSPLRGGIVGIGQADNAVDDPSWAVKTVENPSDLTGVGIELSELLSGMATAADDDEQIAVCFDGITSLLQYADLQRAFRFLHVVTGRVRKADARCYYHLNPTAHGQQTMATLGGLFDTTVEREDGNWSVTR